MQEESTEKKKLFDAAESGDLSTVRFFLDETCIPFQITNDNRQTVAHVAAKHGHLDIVKYMAEKQASILAQEDRSENTPFLLAVQKGALDIVKYIVEEHQTYAAPVFLTVQTAVQGGHLDILKYFLEERNVDVNILNNLQETPLFLAVESEHPRIVEYLIEEKKANLTTFNINKENILFVTVTVDNFPLMKNLWDEKRVPIDVNWQNRYGDTLLHRAAIMNRTAIVEYLVDRKHANLNIQGTDKMTPLHCAACVDAYGICKYLVERGADTRIQDEEDHFPWQKAFDQDLIEYLTNASASRSRRSVDSRKSSYQPISLVYERDSTRVSGYLGSALADISSFQLQNFVMTAQWILGNVKGLGYKLMNERPFFSSPQQVIHSKIDPIAVNAVHSVFNCVEE